MEPTATHTTDLWMAFALVIVCSVGMFQLGRTCSSKVAPKHRWLPALVACMGIGVFNFMLKDSTTLAAWMPWKSLPVTGNWLLPLGALLAGCLWDMPRFPVWRRLILTVPLLGLCAFTYREPLTAKAPPCVNAWKGEVCLQSTPGNCGAAATATLLKAWNIPASESEMAVLCRTDKAGTTTFGICRGLLAKTDGLDAKVRVGRMSMDQLQSGCPLPAIVIVKLTRELDARDPRYSRDWGWVRDVKHAIVLYKVRDDGKIEVGDPSFGREVWDQKGLRELWTGEYLSLIQSK